MTYEIRVLLSSGALVALVLVAAWLTGRGHDRCRQCRTKLYGAAGAAPWCPKCGQALR